MIVLALSAGCQDSTGSRGQAPVPVRPAPAESVRNATASPSSPKGPRTSSGESVHAGAANAAKELGDVEILWKGPQLESDREGQIAVVQGFITKHVDGICLAPNDSQAPRRLRRSRPCRKTFPS